MNKKDYLETVIDSHKMSKEEGLLNKHRDKKTHSQCQTY